MSVTASVVTSTTDLMVGTFDPIICSGYVWFDEVLQYTLYDVMIPFLGMGALQFAVSIVGCMETGNKAKDSGDDGTTLYNQEIHCYG